MSPDQPAAVGKRLLSRTLRLGSGLLGCAVLLALAREGLTGGSRRTATGLCLAYAMVLAAYAATREWEKWADPHDQASYRGHWYLLAWCLLPTALWLADISNLAATRWPDSLNGSLGCVLAVYLGSQASARWRGIKCGTFDRVRPLPPDCVPLATDRPITRHALRLGAMLLAAVCLCDAGIEGFSAGEWAFTGRIYASYVLVLGAYSAQREWTKWTGPYDPDPHWGRWFVLAWCILPAVLWLAGARGAWTVRPSHLNATLAAVLVIFAACKASGLWRAKRMGEGEAK
jgi:hypothetical protein